MHFGSSILPPRNSRCEQPSTELGLPPISMPASIDETFRMLQSPNLQPQRSLELGDQLEKLREEMKKTAAEIKLTPLRSILTVVMIGGAVWGVSAATIELAVSGVNMLSYKVGAPVIPKDVMELLAGSLALLPASYFARAVCRGCVSRFRSLVNSRDEQRERLCMFSDSVLNPGECEIKAEIKKARRG